VKKRDMVAVEGFRAREREYELGRQGGARERTSWEGMGGMRKESKEEIRVKKRAGRCVTARRGGWRTID
jgi:hypothetical protein